MRNWSIWAKFVIFYLVTQITVLAIFGYFGATSLSQAIFNEKQKQADSISSLVATASMPAIFSNDFVSLQDELSTLVLSQTNRDVLSVTITDSQDKIIAKSARPGAEGEKNTMKVTKPITFEGERFGQIDVIFSLTPSTQQTNQTTVLLSIVFLIVSIVTSGLVLFFVTRVVTEPLAHFVTATDNIIKGDLSQRIALNKRDEIGKLAAAFNEMTETLEAQSKDLEHRVSELVTLYKTGLSITATLEIEKLLNLVLENAAGVLPVSRGSIMLLNKRNDTLVVKAVYGMSRRAINRTKIPLGSGIAGKVASTGRAVLIIDHNDNNEYGEYLKDEEAVSAVIVPLKSGEKVFGAISLIGDPKKSPLTRGDRRLLETIAAQAAIAIQNAMLFDEIHVMYVSTVRALAELIDARDHYTHGHSERVANYSVAIAKEMNLPSNKIDAIETAAFLHDIGKIGIPDEVLLKAGKLSPEEEFLMKTHPQIGANILRPIRFPWEVIPLVYQNHEKFDGNGYPERIAGTDIDIGARIITVADAYEAMISERSYRPALSLRKAVKELKACSGTQFDPEVVDAFLKVLDR